jgi:DNA-binding MarR family transcriptional regulator
LTCSRFNDYRLDMGRLQDDLRQRRPFASPAEEAYLNLIRTADQLARGVALVLRPHKLSEAQYNVLRILRGAGTEGHTCSEVATRLVTHDPDVTRLLDRLETRGLLVRAREHSDRRVVTTRITRQGLALLDTLDGPVRDAVIGPRARPGRLADVTHDTSRTGPHPCRAHRTRHIRPAARAGGQAPAAPSAATRTRAPLTRPP